MNRKVIVNKKIIFEEKDDTKTLNEIREKLNSFGFNFKEDLTFMKYDKLNNIITPIILKEEEGISFKDTSLKKINAIYSRTVCKPSNIFSVLYFVCFNFKDMKYVIEAEAEMINNAKEDWCKDSKGLIIFCGKEPKWKMSLGASITNQKEDINKILPNNRCIFDEDNISFTNINDILSRIDNIYINSTNEELVYINHMKLMIKEIWEDLLYNFALN